MKQTDTIIPDSMLSDLCCAGPLNLNRKTKKADTVFQTELYLDDKEFDALLLLVEHEDDFLTFERLYDAVWDASDGLDNRDVAAQDLGSLVRKVSEAGEGFMWIEFTTESGYCFRTRWGHNWKSRAE